MDLKDKKNRLLRSLDKKRKSKNPFYKTLIYVRDKSGIFRMRRGANLQNKIFLPELKSIYLNIPKVASSSIKEVLKKNNQYRIIKNWNKKIEKKYLDCFKFAFVRNPYDRIASLYCNKVLNTGADDLEAGIFIGFLKYHKFYPKMQFKKFVKAICSIPDKYADPHFCSQYYLLSDKQGRLIPGMIGKFENLDEDYKKIMKQIGFKNPPNLSIKNQTRKGKDYRDYYDEETKKLVENRYKKDLEMFGYEF